MKLLAWALLWFWPGSVRQIGLGQTMSEHGLGLAQASCHSQWAACCSHCGLEIKIVCRHGHRPFHASHPQCKWVLIIYETRHGQSALCSGLTRLYFGKGIPPCRSFFVLYCSFLHICTPQYPVAFEACDFIIYRGLQMILLPKDIKIWDLSLTIGGNRGKLFISEDILGGFDYI